MKEDGWWVIKFRECTHPINSNKQKIKVECVCKEMTDIRAHVTMLLWSSKDKCRDNKQSSSNMRPTFPLVCAHWSAMLPIDSSASQHIQINWCAQILNILFSTQFRIIFNSQYSL